eukprot:TRINITY_DN15131_c0_g2_i1.p1 TRINITY_DN15131_c0_g2~~TRINITY_DN15131_c0_g2_i1.p1  ORF type:complete len:787 (-),score=132.84 TRINITY_DN15131_c0_g2_i1:32-2392(-)
MPSFDELLVALAAEHERQAVRAKRLDEENKKLKDVVKKAMFRKSPSASKIGMDAPWQSDADWGSSGGFDDHPFSVSKDGACEMPTSAFEEKFHIAPVSGTIGPSKSAALAPAVIGPPVRPIRASSVPATAPTIRSIGSRGGSPRSSTNSSHSVVQPLPFDLNACVNRSASNVGASTEELKLKDMRQPQSYGCGIPKTQLDLDGTTTSLVTKDWASGMTPEVSIARTRAQTPTLRPSGTRSLGRKSWVINPSKSKFMPTWDVIVVLALCWVALIVPVQVAMMEPSFDVMFVLSACIDVVFFVDMILQFFLMYPRQCDFGFVWEYRHHMIIGHYLRRWFVLDFVSVFPFDLVSKLFESDGIDKAKVIKIIRLLRLLKLTRVMKASRFVRRFETSFSVTYQKLELLKFCFALLIMAHWLACGWAMTLQFVEADQGIPRWIDTFADLETNVEVKTEGSLWKTYLASVYFVSYTITSVGYGDIGPKNEMERVVCTVMIWICGYSWAYVLGQVCGIVSNMNADEQEFRKNMDDLNAMMEDRRIEVNLRKRLRIFFLETKRRQRHMRHHDLLARMSPALQGEFAFATSRKWLFKVSFLKDVLPTTGETLDFVPSWIVDLALALQVHVYAQSEVFGRPFVFYIMNRGLATRKMRLLRLGSVWGEDFVLAQTKYIDMSRCFALTFVEVSSIDREAFQEVVNAHIHTFPQLAKRVRRYAVKLAFRRAVLAEVEWRRGAPMGRDTVLWPTLTDAKPTPLAAERSELFEEARNAPLCKVIRKHALFSTAEGMRFIKPQ